MKELKINPELRDLIPPLDPKEFQILEESILKEGIRDRILVWKEEQTIIDGHHRYQLAQAHNLPFRTKSLSFKNIQQVKDWMEDNQLGRRNLTDDQRRILIGKRYLREKKKKGGKNEEGLSTAEKISIDTDVSPSTVRRYARDAKFYETLRKTDPKAAQQVWEGKTSLKAIQQQQKAQDHVPNPSQRPTKTHLKKGNKIQISHHEIFIFPNPNPPEVPTISLGIPKSLTKLPNLYFIAVPLTPKDTNSLLSLKPESLSVILEPLLLVGHNIGFPPSHKGAKVKFNPFEDLQPLVLPNNVLEEVIDLMDEPNILDPMAGIGSTILVAHQKEVSVTAIVEDPYMAEIIIHRLREFDSGVGDPVIP